MSRHYLDHASTSPCRPVAAAAVAEWLGVTGDPSRVHTEGLEVRQAIEWAREQVASLFGARSREVVFCSGATEAVNAAVWGAAETGGAIITTAVEHSAVREAAARHGEVVVPVDGLGHVDPDDVDRTVTAAGDVSLVCVQWANHEVGTIQPVAEIVGRCRDRGVPVLVDAATAAGHVPIEFDELGADFLAVSAHKLGGPPGIGALLVRRGVRVRPLLVGADQERARRAGSENAPAVMGFGAAAEELRSSIETEAAAARAATERIAAAALAVEGVVAYGDTVDRVPHLACFGIEDVEAEAVVIGLDRAGIAVHSGSACSSEAFEPSPILAAMGVPADHSLRVSVGWSTTADDVGSFVARFPAVLHELRQLRS